MRQDLVEYDGSASLLSEPIRFDHRRLRYLRTIGLRAPVLESCGRIECLDRRKTITIEDAIYSSIGAGIDQGNVPKLVLQDCQYPRTLAQVLRGNVYFDFDALPYRFGGAEAMLGPAGGDDTRFLRSIGRCICESVSLSSWNEFGPYFQR